MKASHIFTCWITAPSGIVRRIEVEAHDQATALAAAFCLHPDAIAASARQVTDAPPADALGFLDRRASDAVMTDDERAGMDWWNGLAESDRRFWCLAALTAIPERAWRYFKQVTQ